jgi:hypothetical protein
MRRTLTITLVALVAGFIGGVVLTEIIAVIGYVGFGRLIGIKFLPIYLAVASAIIAPLAATAMRQRKQRSI